MKHALAFRAPLGRRPVTSPGLPAVPPRPRPRSAPRPRTEPPPPRRLGSGVYPSPFGFVLSVPVGATEQLVPIVGASASALAPLAGALGLVRASGGFRVDRTTLPTAHARLTFFEVRDLARAKRRVAVLARDLLALAQSSLPARERLRFRPALELRSSGASTLCLSVYGDGPIATDEDTVLGLAQIMLGPLSRLIEANASISTETLLLRRVRVSCRIALDEIVAQLASRRRAAPERERIAVRDGLDWFGATRASSALAAAWNEIVLAPVADVARALGQNGHHILAEGQRHACRFGSIASLARFELEGRFLECQLQLPSGLGRRARRHDMPSELAHRLLLGHSAEDVTERATCVGLAAGLASLKAAVSLALSGRVRCRAPRSAEEGREEALEETRVMSLHPALQGPSSLDRLRASADETRVMSLGKQTELQRSMRRTEPPQPRVEARARDSAPPQRSADTERSADGRRGAAGQRNSETRLRAPDLRRCPPPRPSATSRERR